MASALLTTSLRESNKQYHSIYYPFYFSLTLVIICMFFFMTSKGIPNLFDMTYTELLVNIFAAVASLGGQMFVSVAYKFTEASKLASLWNLQILFNFVIERYFLKHAFENIEILGIACIAVGLTVPIILKSEAYQDYMSAKTQTKLKV